MTSKLRLRDTTLLMLLVGCGALGVGCSATSGSRFRPAEGSKSVASVGDQALPPSVGSPGSRVVADAPEPEPYRNPKARISGRVVDPQGRPVSGAEVRLADGSSKAGQDIETTTDPSGGFTLSNLRPGSNYFLVAEANFGDDRGTITGKAQADTSETGVQIRLGDSGATNPKSSPTRRRGSRSSKALPISERVDGEIKPASPGGVNEEDLGPPVEAAELVNPPEARKPRKSTKAEAGSSASTSGWRRPGSDPVPKGDPPPDPAEPDADEPLDLDPGAKAGTASRPGRTRSENVVEADEENPLPPALPPRSKADDEADDPPARPISRKAVKPPTRQAPRPEPEPDPSGELTLGAEVEAAADGPGPLGEADESMSAPKPMPSLMSLADSPPVSLDQVPGLVEAPPPAPPAFEPQNLATQANPATSTPGDLVFDANPEPPPATAPEAGDPSANYNPFALAAVVPLDSSRAVATRSPAPSPPASEGSTSEDQPATSEPPTNPASKPRKWSDLAPVVPVAASPTVAKVSTAASAVGTTRPNVLPARRSKASAAAKPDAEPLCRFDPRLNQLVDFQLPDLAGQPVRFRDLDADYVLLDFWGTWCRPCRDSIPHLVELQKKYGPNKLRVVGIACEKDLVERRRASVGSMAEKLGINYSVLVTTMDGSCPVQNDFQVRFYPTMILLDRKGKILWRAEGATPGNLDRLDRVLAATARR